MKIASTLSILTLLLGYKVSRNDLRMSIRVTGEKPAHHQQHLCTKDYKK